MHEPQTLLTAVTPNPPGFRVFEVYLSPLGDLSPKPSAQNHNPTPQTQNPTPKPQAASSPDLKLESSILVALRA